MAVKINKEKCDGCGVCMKACPMDAIKIVGGKAKANGDCTGCGCCIGDCPEKAISE